MNDLLSCFSGGQFAGGPIEDEVLSCFSDGQFGIRLVEAVRRIGGSVMRAIDRRDSDDVAISMALLSGEGII